MLFSSMVFLWIFLPVVLVVSRFMKIKYQNIFLLIASLFFYAWGEPKYVLLMLFSIFINWGSGILLDRFSCKKRILVLSILTNLGLLGYFKYTGLLVRTLNLAARREIIPMPAIALPIGISFFTFQALSYVIDVYRGDCKVQNNILHLALYVSFFPQLIAGPIVKYRDVNEQIVDRALTTDKMVEGIRRFIYGLSKKVLISNTLALAVDRIWALEMSEITGALAWTAAILYTFQIYYDFSGYSDMAIGLGKMFGFDFLENFNYPYTSLSVKEFWRRWHISLSTWFREYVYIPLGGSRRGIWRTYFNLGIVFLLTGIWHGASYNFLFWGIYHGIFLILERTRFGKILEKHKIFAGIYTSFVVVFGWILFRIESMKQIVQISKRFFLPWAYGASHYCLWEFVDGYTLFMLLCAILGMGTMQRLFERKAGTLVMKWKYSIPELAYCVLLLTLCISSLASNTYNPFIYFRF